MSSRRDNVTRHSAKRKEKRRRLQRCRLLLARDLHASDTWHHGRHFPARCGLVVRVVNVLWDVDVAAYYTDRSYFPLYVFPSYRSKNPPFDGVPCFGLSETLRRRITISRSETLRRRI